MNAQRIIIALLLTTSLMFQTWAGEKDKEYSTIISLPYSPVKNQGNTGTCWSFATTSFLESELLRRGKGEFDLSEMFFVRAAYENKARAYLFFQGNNNFSQGGQVHDVLNVVASRGIVPDMALPGKKQNGKFAHSNLEKILKSQVEKQNRQRRDFLATNISSFEPILNSEIGTLPETFIFNSKEYTPATFRDFLEINPDDYIELTSFMHHPYYKPFVLEIPDNWSHGLYYNLPIDELISVMDYSLEKGITFCWDGDTSEKYFTHRRGIAELPDDEKGTVTQKYRQQTFENRETTDDHVMHVVGLSQNEKGDQFYITKNSWGAESNHMDGFLNIGKDYVRLKTIAILVHKSAIPEEILRKLNLK